MKNPNFKILNDEEKNSFLVENGYIVLPILNVEELSVFKQLYKKWHPTAPDKFYKSYFSDNMDYKIEVEEKILEYFEPRLKNIMHSFEAFGAMFVVKPNGEKGQIPPHQDWSFVDEEKHWSLNAWCPLQDTTERNGTIRVLKGSHLFKKTIRGANTPEWYSENYDEIEKNLIDVEIKAGEAIFFFHGILHCSHLNVKEEERVCLGLSVIQKDIPIYFHLLKEEEQLADKYAVDTSFYMEYASNRGGIPKGVLHLGKDELAFEKINPNSFEKMMKYEFNN